MDDPEDIAAAFATNARNMVAESQKVAVDAFQKINPKDGHNQPMNFTAGDAIRTMTKLAQIAVTGGIEMGQTALDIQPNKGVLILADYIATVLSRAVKDTATVASEASDLIDKNSYDQNEWTQSAIKLTNIALLRGAEIAQSVAAGPAQYASPIAKETLILGDDEIDSANDRALRLSSLKLGGPADQSPVPGYRISFEPSDGVLRAGMNSFTLVVNSSGLASGVYIGSVDISVPGANPPQILNLPFSIAL
jgi:hypothetical protein